MSRRDTTDEALRRLRQEAPVTDERLAAPWQASSAKEVMLEAIGGEAGETGVTAMGRQHGRRRGGALLRRPRSPSRPSAGPPWRAASSPDPRDAAEVGDQGRHGRAAARARLAHRAQCRAGAVLLRRKRSDRAETTASAGPLDAGLRVEDLVAACAQGGWVDPGAAKLCALPAGPLRRNPKPVVLGFDGACERYGLDDGDRFSEVDTGRLLADINLRRQVEVAIRAVDPKLDGKCPRSPSASASSSNGSPPAGCRSRSASPARLALLVRRGCGVGRQRRHGW